MLVEITWTKTNAVQTLQLINHCRVNVKDQFFTMNSPIYKAIEDGSFCIDLGFGKHHFTINQLT